jgi:hypothetical protein
MNTHFPGPKPAAGLSASRVSLGEPVIDWPLVHAMSSGVTGRSMAKPAALLPLAESGQRLSRRPRLQ